METLVVLAALTGIAASSQLVHGETDGLVGFLRECTETHGSCHKVLYDALHRLHLVDRDGVLLEVEEVAQEDWCVLVVNEF